jgi:hypothetical protein
VNAIKSLYDNIRIAFNRRNKDITRTPPPPGVNQGCGLSSILLDLYIKNPKGLQRRNNKYIKTILSPDDQVLPAGTENHL